MFEIHPVKKVSVVIPVYNEQESLPELIRRTTAACESLGKEYEILLIDDGSSDNSAHMLVEASQAEGSHIVSILLNRNYGQHSAIMAGFSHVTGDLIITLDADLQNPPEEIPRLVAKADEGYDVVGTVRQNRQDSWFRKTASKMINRLIQRTTGKAMGDYGCMLRAYRRHIVDAMLHCHERSTFIPILANIFARRAIEIPVHHAEREFGESKYSFMRLINLMYDLVTCLTTTPLRMLSLLGSIIAIGGFSIAVLLVILRLTFGPQWAAEGVFMLFAVLFTFIGAQFIGQAYVESNLPAPGGSLPHELQMQKSLLVEQAFRIWSVIEDSNLRPLRPERSALPGCANHRMRGASYCADTPSSIP